MAIAKVRKGGYKICYRILEVLLQPNPFVPEGLAEEKKLTLPKSNQLYKAFRTLMTLLAWSDVKMSRAGLSKITDYLAEKLQVEGHEIVSGLDPVLRTMVFFELNALNGIYSRFHSEPQRQYLTWRD